MGNQKSRAGGGGKPPPPLNRKARGTAEEHFEHASKTGVLQFVNGGLKEIPPQALQLRATLRTLDLSQNRLSSLPSFVGDFRSLKVLTLDSNTLHSLPDELGSLKKLETLSLRSNHLSALPDTLVGLLALKSLHLSNNAFTRFPTVVCDLPRLECVDLAQNRVETLPEDDARLGRLHAMELNLNQNRLTALSDALADCANLKVLRVQENVLPVKAFTRRVLAESRIALLQTEGNLFQDKHFHQLDGYEQYMERYTATKKKMY